MDQSYIVAVIVTYNRRPLLEKCLTAIRDQYRQPDLVLVVDNASTDGTQSWLAGWLPDELPQGKLIELSENLGGAGGFTAGMRAAMTEGCDWIWMMDDDAEPDANALSSIMANVLDQNAIYGSIATPDGVLLSWPLFSTERHSFTLVTDVPNEVDVAALPFLGILISKRVIGTIGYPDPDYFIAGDDTEYCFRARTHSIPVIAVGSSLIYHPSSSHYHFGVGPFKPVCFHIPPWKRYYDVRNRILTSSKLYGKRNAIFKSIPGALIRLLATLINEPDRWQQTRAYFFGIIDGLREIKGKRHQTWRLGK